MGRPGLTKHRKFKRLAHALEPVLPGMGELLARGCLETIWESAYETGNDYVGTAEDVESLAGWQGKRGLLCGAMEAAGCELGGGCYLAKFMDTALRGA